jgi:hypothetical protein
MTTQNSSYTIQVRLRPGKDDDLIDWYIHQADRSGAVREAIRAWLQQQDDCLQGAALVRQELARLPELVTTTLHTVLADVQLNGMSGKEAHPAVNENAELASRLDTQLDNFFED